MQKFLFSKEYDIPRLIHNRTCQIKREDKFLCGNQEDICITNEQLCDGVANCPHAEDEDFQMCQNKSAFSPMATVKCLKRDIYNLDITILATKCNGITECKYGEDEMNCSIPEEYVAFTGVIAFLIVILIGICLWNQTIKGELIEDINSNTMTKNNFDKHHKSDEMKVHVFYCQGYKNMAEINRSYFAYEMEKHNWNVNETYCCIKVCIAFLNDSVTNQLKKCPFLNSNSEYFGFFYISSSLQAETTIKDQILFGQINKSNQKNSSI